MTERSVTHATFVIERTYAATPARVFAAFASHAAKASWFQGPAEWGPSDHELDFKVGGRERVRGGPKGGPVHSFDARFQDIVPNQRIISSYDMHLDDKRISVSLATVEFKPARAGTRLIFTEQAAFLDGYNDLAGREEGTRAGLDNLDAELKREIARA